LRDIVNQKPIMEEFFKIDKKYAQYLVVGIAILHMLFLETTGK